jgi:hypothetical protein
MADGIEVMPAEALTRIEGMRKAVLDHPNAGGFFRGKGRSEVVGIWRDRATGVLCKIRLDREIDRAAWIHADVKTCADASVKIFPRHAARMGYVHRSAWYRRGLEALGRPATASVLIAVERTKPHGVQPFLLNERDLGVIGGTIDAQLHQFAECLQRDVWPGYPDGLRELSLPPWELPEQEFPSTDNAWTASADNDDL